MIASALRDFRLNAAWSNAVAQFSNLDSPLTTSHRSRSSSTICILNYWKVRILNTVKLDEAEGRQHSGRDRSGCWKPLEGKNEDSKVID
ncbi:unnamed protein product [Phytophthora lilii]|uniref:Unnamed protein product n=1 Tax=Phytophthora lilii TaxID=2077276 RepID=A0A9W6YDP9_9STRA|nr:unnamed protein product [Phytophthora lilii]